MLKEQLDKTLLDFFSKKIYRPGRAGYICDVAFVLDNNKVLEYPSQGCHAVISRRDEKTTAIYTSLKVRDAFNRKKAEAYWDFLFDKKESPFRKALTKYEIIKNTEGHYVAFGLLDMDVPIQIGTALLMQSRTPFEIFPKVETFSMFVEAGFSRVEAFYFSEILIHISSGFVANTHTHSALVPQVSFKKLVSGNPSVALENTFKTTKHYTPVQRPWLGSSDARNRLLKLLESNPAYKGSFSTLFKKLHPSMKLGKSSIINTPKIYDVIRKNRKVWATQ